MNPYDFYITPEEYEQAAANGISRKTLTKRIRAYGWDKARALVAPVQQQRKPSAWRQAALDNGLQLETFYARIRNGWDEERAATTPLLDGQKLAAESRRKYSKELHEIRKQNGISRSTFASRIIESGWDPMRAATEPAWTNKQASEYGLERYKAKYGESPNKILFPKV